MLLVKHWFSVAYSKPLEIIAGLCVFATAAVGGAVESVASTSLAVLFLTCLFYIQSWPQAWRNLTRGESLILVGLGLYCLSAVLAYYNVNDEQEYLKHLGRYLRFLLIVPIYLLLSRVDLKLFKYLLAGAIVSGPLYLSIALMSIADRPGLPAQGGYHHITFGDMVMLNAMIMTVALATIDMGKAFKAVFIVSIICALYASVLSQARGSWLALPFCLSVLMYVIFRYEKIKIKTVLAALVVLLAVVAVSPVKDIVGSRWKQAEHEIELFQKGEKFSSSVGSRIAMWHVAIEVWKKYPFVGTGPGDFDGELQSIQAQGLYERIQVHSSAHNIFFQALATTGTIGLVVMCFALVILPFRFFYRINKMEMDVAAISGMVMITAFTVFGLTESWILRSPVVSVFLLYFVILATTTTKKTSESG